VCHYHLSVVNVQRIAISARPPFIGQGICPSCVPKTQANVNGTLENDAYKVKFHANRCIGFGFLRGQNLPFFYA